MAAVKTIADKLGIRVRETVRLIGAEDDTAGLLHPLPDGAVISSSEPADVAVVFVTSAADLRERLATDVTALHGMRSVWIAYRKGNVIDMNRNTIIIEAELAGWTTVSNVAMGEAWSAVRIRPQAV